MFTGIIESMGSIVSVTAVGSNRVFWIESTLSGDFKIDQSVSHNGVCLTVEEVKDGRHRVTAIEETLRKTDLDAWEVGRLVNLERSMLMNGRLDGHIVQGHADCTAICLDKKALEGSWEFRFQFPEKFAPLTIEKGSISVNGISLTIFNVTKDNFTVAIIPYTFDHTNLGRLEKGEPVNIEFDIVGKYINRKMQLQGSL